MRGIRRCGIEVRRLRAYTGYDGMIMNSNTAEHLEWHVDAFLLKLRIDEWWNGGGKGATIVDIGAGTGDFTHALAKRVTAYHKVLCVEPNREALSSTGSDASLYHCIPSGGINEDMLQNVMKFEELEPMLLDASSFSKIDPLDISYSHVVMKDMVNHLPLLDLASIFEGCYHQIQPGGYISVNTRPPNNNFPIFKEAFKVWEAREHCPRDIAKAMESAGFAVEISELPHDGIMDLHEWYNAVLNRCCSTFAKFSDDQLLQGVEEMKNTYGNTKEIKVCDTLVFITGHKPSNGAQIPCGLPFYEVENIKTQKFLGPIKLFSEDFALPGWEDMLQPDETLDSNSLEIFRCIGLQSVLYHPFLSELIDNPGILQLVSHALGCHNLVCSSLVVSTGQKGCCGSENSAHDDRLGHPTVGVAVHVAFTPAKHIKCDLQCLPLGSMSSEEEDMEISDHSILDVTIDLAPGEMSLHYIEGGICSESTSQGVITICYMPAHETPDSSTCGAFILVRGRNTIGRN